MFSFRGFSFGHSQVMKVLLIGAGVLLGASQTQPGGVEAALKAHQWKQRIILVYAADSTHGHWLKQREILKSTAASLQARDLTVMEVVAGRLQGQPLTPADQLYLKQQFGLGNQPFAVVLIEKDGGEKHRTQLPYSSTELLARIDALPMRQQEMRDKKD